MLGTAGAWPTGWVRLGDADAPPVGVGLGVRPRGCGQMVPEALGF